MASIALSLDGFYWARILVAAFFAALFLQSGLDKAFDRKGNLEWMVPHFEKSPFRGLVPVLLTGLTVLEVLTGAVSLAAVIALLVGLWPSAALLSPLLASATLVVLFLGQRLAKDYAGAGVLAAYFAVAVLGLLAAGRPAP